MFFVMFFEFFSIPDKNIQGEANAKHASIPIIAVSRSRELSHTVKVTCSYVIFKPGNAETIREAVLWCLAPHKQPPRTQAERRELLVSNK